MTRNDLSSAWYSYLEHRQQKLVELSLSLYERELTQESQFLDYAFLVFPMAKAYEGFLKKYFYDLQLIDRKTFEGRRFRVGRSLNPDMNPRYRDRFWVYEALSERCGEQVARQLWDTWLECRNRIFHYYPSNERSLSLYQAGAALEQLSEAMRVAVACDSGQEMFHRFRGQTVPLAAA